MGEAESSSEGCLVIMEPSKGPTEIQCPVASERHSPNESTCAKCIYSCTKYLVSTCAVQSAGDAAGKGGELSRVGVVRQMKEVDVREVQGIMGAQSE